MKSILFVVPAFTVGGTNTSLVSLLPFIDTKGYKVFVYALNPIGPMGTEIAKYSIVINPIDSEGIRDKGSLKEKLRSSFNLVLRFIKKVLGSVGIDLTPFYYRKQVHNLSRRQFDCVIAFQEGDATRFVQYFKNTKRVAWIRSSYARYLSVTQTPPEDAIYEKYDLIVNVSKTAMDCFLQVMPQCRKKSLYVYNLVNVDRILSLSKQAVDCVFDSSLFTIVSLGRVDKVKHFSEIPGIADHLKKRGIPFKWYIIGGPTMRYPEEFELIKNSIENRSLQNEVIMLGHQANPYPFLAKSNLLVCLSESETFNHTFAEARLLGVPILSVDYLGAEEFICDNQGGVLSGRDSICDELGRIITDETYYCSLKSQAQAFTYDNEKQLIKLYDCVFGDKAIENE